MRNWFKQKSIAALILILAVYGIIQTILTDILPPFYQLTLILACINIILATSLNLINGFTGQFSIGHAGFMAIGAYLSAIITVKLQGPLVTALLVGGLVAAVVGLLIGLPTLRLKGDYLAIATLGLGEIVRIIFINTEYVGGSTGLSVPKQIGWTWAFWLTVLSFIIIRNFIRSTHGRACLAIRENEIAAETMGINTTKYKVMAFTLGAFFAGLAGGVYANYMYLIQPGTFSFLKTFDILIMVVLGGLGSLTGGVIGAVFMTFINAGLSGFPEWRLVITAVLLVILIIFRPTGLMGTKEFNLNFFGKKG
jgi:branched-chain amino acid transport system permease protein